MDGTYHCSGGDCPGDLDHQQVYEVGVGTTRQQKELVS